MAEETLAERWSAWYVIRGIGGAVLLAAVVRVVLPLFGGLIARIPNPLLLRIGPGPMALVLAFGAWASFLAPLIAGACIVVGVVGTLVGGLRREYRATPGTLLVRRSTFSAGRMYDVDSIIGVEVRVGPVARLFHGGSLRLSTKGGPVRLRDIEHPERWAAHLAPRR